MELDHNFKKCGLKLPTHDHDARRRRQIPRSGSTSSRLQRWRSTSLGGFCKENKFRRSISSHVGHIYGSFFPASDDTGVSLICTHDVSRPVVTEIVIISYVPIRGAENLTFSSTPMNDLARCWRLGEAIWAASRVVSGVNITYLF